MHACMREHTHTTHTRSPGNGRNHRSKKKLPMQQQTLQPQRARLPKEAVLPACSRCHMLLWCTGVEIRLQDLSAASCMPTCTAVWLTCIAIQDSNLQPLAQQS